MRAVALTAFLWIRANIARWIFAEASGLRKGLIGNWRNYLSAGHKRAFKALAGRVLWILVMCRTAISKNGR